jgi:actin-related protein
MAKRLELALADHTPTGDDQQQQQRVAKVVELPQQPHRGDQAWIGGSILASLTSMQGYWATRDMYLEHGERPISLSASPSPASHQAITDTH